MSSMLAPLVVMLVAVLAGLGCHTLVMAWARRHRAGGDTPPDDQGDRRLLGRLVAVAAVASGALLAFGAFGIQVKKPSDELYVASPIGVTLGIVSVVYAVNLYRRFFVARDPTAVTGAFEGFNALVTSSIVMLLLLSLFWNVSHFALVKGRTLAATVEASLPRRPGVIVYTEKRLYLQAPVVETRLEPENAAYSYAYSGLKLLFRADGKYFLRPADPSSSVNIVIPDGPDIRLELFKS